MGGDGGWEEGRVGERDTQREKERQRQRQRIWKLLGRTICGLFFSPDKWVNSCLFIGEKDFIDIC